MTVISSRDPSSMRKRNVDFGVTLKQFGAADRSAFGRAILAQVYVSIKPSATVCYR